MGCKPWVEGGPGRPPIDGNGDTGLNSLPRHLRKQLDGKATRILCLWADWLEYSETILAVQPIERIKLFDWPEIDLGDMRRQAKRAIARQYDNRFVFEVPDKE
jgi:hypothetical protein